MWNIISASGGKRRNKRKADVRQKKGPMHQGDRPKSREETPKKGCETSLSHGFYLAVQNELFKLSFCKILLNQPNFAGDKMPTLHSTI